MSERVALGSPDEDALIAAAWRDVLRWADTADPARIDVAAAYAAGFRRGVRQDRALLERLLTLEQCARNWAEADAPRDAMRWATELRLALGIGQEEAP